MKGSTDMKKTSRFFALVLAIGFISAMLVSCTKTPSDSATFKSIAKTKNYTKTTTKKYTKTKTKNQN